MDDILQWAVLDEDVHHPWFRVERASASEQGYELRVVGSDECMGDLVAWSVSLEQVIEVSLIVPSQGMLTFSERHPWLDALNEGRAELFYAELPTDPHGLDDDVRRAYQALDTRLTKRRIPEAVRTTIEGISTQIGMGKFADGPESVMRTLASVLRTHGMQPSIVKTRRYKPISTLGARVMELGESWAVAARLHSRRLDQGATA